MTTPTTDSTLLPDIAAVFDPDEDRLAAENLLARLAEHHPDRYRGWDGHRMAGELARHGIRHRMTRRHGSAVRRSYLLADIAAALHPIPRTPHGSPGAAINRDTPDRTALDRDQVRTLLVELLTHGPHPQVARPDVLAAIAAARQHRAQRAAQTDPWGSLPADADRLADLFGRASAAGSAVAAAGGRDSQDVYPAVIEVAASALVWADQLAGQLTEQEPPF